jgi:hypothetical protein
VYAGIPGSGRGVAALFGRVVLALSGALLFGFFLGGHWGFGIFFLLLFYGDLNLWRCSCEEGSNERVARWIGNAPARIAPTPGSLTEGQRALLRGFTAIGATITLFLMGWNF